MVRGKVPIQMLDCSNPFPHRLSTVEVAACLQGVPWPALWTHLLAYSLGAELDAISDSLRAEVEGEEGQGN